MFTGFENVGLLVAWMRATLPAVQPRLLLLVRLGPRPPGNNVVFLVLALSFMHFSFPRSLAEGVAIV